MIVSHVWVLYLFISLFIVGNPRLIMHRSSRGTMHNQLWVSNDVSYWAITCFFIAKMSCVNKLFLQNLQQAEKTLNTGHGIWKLMYGFV